MGKTGEKEGKRAQGDEMFVQSVGEGESRDRKRHAERERAGRGRKREKGM